MLLLLLLVLGAGAWLWWAWEREPPAIASTPAVRTNVPAPVLQPMRSAVATNLPVQPLPLEPAQPTPGIVTTAPPVLATSAPPAPVIMRTNVVTRPRVDNFPRPPRDVLEAQIALARRGFSPGSIDGVMGSQTRAALLAFQRWSDLAETAELDDATREALSLVRPPLTLYVVTADDLARLQSVSQTWLGKSQQSALDYETILELVAEKGRASPTLVRRLNPDANWTHVLPGTELRIPDAGYPEPRGKAGFAVITLAEKTMQVFDGYTNLVAHFPCSIAARVEKRPAGELRVVAIAENPNYTFNPEVFRESAEARALGRKLILPPGPNNPVGTAWISLDRPGYGIHGTPSPEQVGRTESHGCFRLANWNAEYLLQLAWIGMPVYVEP